MTIVARSISSTFGRKIDSNHLFLSYDLAAREDRRIPRFVPSRKTHANQPL